MKYGIVTTQILNLRSWKCWNLGLWRLKFSNTRSWKCWNLGMWKLIFSNPTSWILGCRNLGCRNLGCRIQDLWSWNMQLRTHSSSSTARAWCPCSAKIMSRLRSFLGMEKCNRTRARTDIHKHKAPTDYVHMREMTLQVREMTVQINTDHKLTNQHCACETPEINSSLGNIFIRKHVIHDIDSMSMFNTNIIISIWSIPHSWTQSFGNMEMILHARRWSQTHQWALDMWRLKSIPHSETYLSAPP